MRGTQVAMAMALSSVSVAMPFMKLRLNFQLGDRRSTGGDSDE